MSEKIINTTKRSIMERIAQAISNFTGSNSGFFTIVIILSIWALKGIFFGFNESWMLFINTASTIFTLLMVFLIQRTQNKESLALQLKMNEIEIGRASCRERV